MSETLTTIPLYPTVERQDTVLITSCPSASAAPGRPPLFVPRAQLYYWARSWQQGEAEARQELAAGEFETFRDGTAAAQWLLADDDED
ncbi:MAG TPA: hypothetical protein VES61_01065 [Gaiellaceae bacterium]|nr:hypothetical protein [Gaiellaceae bacterium]